MNRDDFLLLSEDEQAAFLQAHATLKTEREKLEKELKSTKELNFTLARRMDNSAGKKSAEEIMNELFK